MNYSIKSVFVVIALAAVLTVVVVAFLEPRLNAILLRHALEKTGVSHVGFDDAFRATWITIADSDNIPLVSDYPEVISVRTIDMSEAKLESHAMRRLKLFTGLKLLDISGAQTSDNVFAEILELKSLEIIRANRTSINDAALIQLLALPNLKLIDVSGTEVTNQGIENASLLRPSLVIIKR